MKTIQKTFLAGAAAVALSFISGNLAAQNTPADPQAKPATPCCAMASTNCPAPTTQAKSMPCDTCSQSKDAATAQTAQGFGARALTGKDAASVAKQSCEKCCNKPTTTDAAAAAQKSACCDTQKSSKSTLTP